MKRHTWLRRRRLRRSQRRASLSKVINQRFFATMFVNMEEEFVHLAHKQMTAKIESEIATTFAMPKLIETQSPQTAISVATLMSVRQRFIESEFMPVGQVMVFNPKDLGLIPMRLRFGEEFKETSELSKKS